MRFSVTTQTSNRFFAYLGECWQSTENQRPNIESSDHERINGWLPFYAWDLSRSLVDFPHESYCNHGNKLFTKIWRKHFHAQTDQGTGPNPPEWQHSQASWGLNQKRGDKVGATALRVNVGFPTPVHTSKAGAGNWRVAPIEVHHRLRGKPSIGSTPGKNE